jgi:aminoglycoside phosphotransferase (APT) family kinase protein
VVNPQENAAFAGFREVVPLSGFSGAFVALLRDDAGRLFVRKAAETADLNAKLRRQAERQAWLSGVLAGAAEAPAVEREGEADGLYWYDMAFAAGRDATSYLSTTSFEAVEEFAACIRAVVERLAASAPEHPVAQTLSEVLAGKLAEIDHRTEGRFAGLLAPLHEGAGILRAELTPTATHGDLTFENIIVDRHRRLWLLDTIDSPLDHYWMDWSKLFQECEGRWHEHRRRSLSLSVSWGLRQRFFEIARGMDPRYPGLHYLLLGLTFARILPYARSEADIAFVSRRVAAFGERAIRDLESCR